VLRNTRPPWAATAELRGKQTGQLVWTFDPQRIAHAAQSWWWNPLAGLDTVEEAERLAGHFVLTVDDERSKDIWARPPPSCSPGCCSRPRPPAAR